MRSASVGGRARATSAGIGQSTAIDGNTITLDAPITTAIEKRFGGATVAPYDWPGRIENVGVEDLRMESAPLDRQSAR